MSAARFEMTLELEKNMSHHEFFDTLEEARAEVRYWKKYYGTLPDASIWDHKEMSYRALEEGDPVPTR